MIQLEDERIVVTGGAGFLGKRLIMLLKKTGAVDNQILIPEIEKYDLSKEAIVEKMYHEMTPSVVFHLAALVGGIGANRSHPGLFFYKNLVMGVMLMEYARLANVKKFIAIGTICAYPKMTPVPFREENLWDGYPEETNAPYGLAKKMLLVQSQAYRSEYHFNSIFLLPVNLYGPGDNFDLRSSHVIPALIRKCVEAKEHNLPVVEVWGAGKATREFLYVDDAARGILLAAQYYDDSEPCNLGAGFEISIEELVAKISRLVGFNGSIRWDASKPDGQPRRSLDVMRAQKSFGFKASVDLDEGLSRTIEWYLVNRSLCDQ